MRARGGVAGRLGPLTGRLSGRLVAHPVPAGAVVAVGGRDAGWSLGGAAFVLFVGVSGPARLHYAVVDPVGPTWLRLVELREWRRRRVLRAVLGCGVLESGGPRGARAVAAAGDGAVPVDAGPDGSGPDGVVPAGSGAPFGWLQVATATRSVWTDLPEDGRVGGVAVRDLVVGLVPWVVWRELDLLRTDAWRSWEERTRLLGARVQGAGPDGAGGGRAGGGEGWPGIRHGGGLGGAL